MKIQQNIVNWIVTTVRTAAWAPVSVFGFYLIGLLFGLYDAFPLLDIPTHLMGGVSITYFFRSAIRNSQPFLGDIPPLVQTLFAFTCTGTTTVLWELYENFLDHFFGTTMVRGLEDTIVDLIVGLSGAVILSLFYKRH
jgi:hypothetical protein